MKKLLKIGNVEFFMGNVERKSLLEIPRWEDNIKIDHNGIG
jgi:hypothetical protein